MKAALFLILVGVAISSGYQDINLKRQTYLELKTYNPDLVIDEELERLARGDKVAGLSNGAKRKCVRSHFDHRDTDEEARQNDPSENKSAAYIIACTGGCKEGQYTNCGGDRPSSLLSGSDITAWTTRLPTYFWLYCKCQNKHYKTIVNYTRIGCSFERHYSGDRCIFCYLNGKKSGPEKSFPKCENA